MSAYRKYLNTKSSPSHHPPSRHVLNEWKEILRRLSSTTLGWPHFIRASPLKARRRMLRQASVVLSCLSCLSYVSCNAWKERWRIYRLHPFQPYSCLLEISTSSYCTLLFRLSFSQVIASFYPWTDHYPPSFTSQ